MVGTALSPEFVYALGPGALMPDDKRFGVVWMGREALEAAFDLKGAFNDLAVGLLRGADTDSVIKAIDRLLGPYGGFRAVARADQLSNWFVMNEIEQLKTMSTVLPTIFLAIAAFLTYMVLMRLIATERSEIGLLKAFGYGNFEVSWHYMKLVFAIATVGIVAGSVLGAAFGLHNTRLYAEFFRFPLLIYRPSPAAFVIAALVSVGTTALGAIAAVRRAATLPPAEAMRPPQPIVYRRGRLASSRLVARLDQPTRIALRQIGRWPLRSFFTTLGIAMSLGLLVMALQWSDMIEEMAQRYFYDAQRQTMMIGLAEPQAMTAVEAFKHLPGVLAVEPTRIVGADFSVGTRKHRGGITGVRASRNAAARARRRERRRHAVPPAGLVMSTRLAEKLGVGVGDRVWVEIQKGRRPSVELPVVRLFETLIAMPVYMDIDALNRLLEERPSLEYANLLVDRNAEPELFKKLKTLPGVGAIMLKHAAIDSFYDTIGEQMLIYTGIFALFAAALGFGVTYNSTRIALSERGTRARHAARARLHARRDLLHPARRSGAARGCRTAARLFGRARSHRVDRVAARHGAVPDTGGDQAGHLWVRRPADARRGGGFRGSRASADRPARLDPRTEDPGVGMHANLRRLVFWGALATLIALGLALAFRPQLVAVDTAKVARGTLVVTVEDEGRTRVHDIYTLSAPVTGRMHRVEVHVGDPVTKLKTVLAEIEPIDPAFLDPRSEAQARADVRAAESAQTLARAEVEQAQAELDFAHREVDRARDLIQQGSISQRDLDQAERSYRTRRAALATAQAALDRSAYQLERARAQLVSPAERQREAQSARASRCARRSTARCCSCCSRARASSKPARP